MGNRYLGKYRVDSARIKNWDYASAAIYFITICTYNRVHYFGQIKDGNVVLSELGMTAFTQWQNTPTLRPDMNLELGEFVIMPNHIHAILRINRNDFNKEILNRKARNEVVVKFEISNCVNPPKQSANQFSPQSKNLASIVRGFKSSVTQFARINNIPFQWQDRYHDRIIRSHQELINVTEYILNNPSNWEEDDYY